MRFRTEPEGEWFEFDQDRLLVKEARMLEELTGMGLQEFGQGLQRGKVDSIVFMIFLCHKRAGRPVQWKQFDELNLADLEMESEEEPATAEGDADAAAEGDADATAEVPEGAEEVRPTKAAAPAKKPARKRAAATTSA